MQRPAGDLSAGPLRYFGADRDAISVLAQPEYRKHDHLFKLAQNHYEYIVYIMAGTVNRFVASYGVLNNGAMRGQEIREQVRAAYSSAAENPEGQHPFPVGRAFAESLGYPPDWLNEIPCASLDAFAGVSTVPCFADVPEDGVVLDMGCGAGLDSLLISRRMRATGRVVGVDFSWPMLERARSAAIAVGAMNVVFAQAEAERLPLNDGVIDVALVNGIFNLNPARTAIFRELARCIRPGGRLYGAELILREPLPPEARENASNWFA